MKKLLSLFLTAVIASSCLNVMSFGACAANEYISTDTVYNSIVAMKTKYPEGMAWTNENTYSWNGGIYGTGGGCYGFAFAMSDAAFGKLPARVHKAFSRVKVGDIVRIHDDSHAVIVLEKDGNILTVAEGNLNNKIHWGRKIDISDPSIGLTWIMTRYPKCGDVDKNGSVDAQDASAVLEEYARLSTNQPSAFDDLQKWAGDTNCNGVVDASDASDILTFYAYIATHEGDEEIPIDEVR